MRASEQGVVMAIDPVGAQRLVNDLSALINGAENAGVSRPVLLVAGPLRLPLRRLLRGSLPQLRGDRLRRDRGVESIETVGQVSRGHDLLLEGDDLEALLSRVHAEGGPGARIVRAEKVRQGGFMGFFARERFEVAVEVPEGNAPATPEASPKETRAAAKAEARADRKARRGRRPEDEGQTPEPLPEQHDEPQQWSGGPAEALLGMLEAATGDEARFEPLDSWDDQPAFTPAAFAQAAETEPDEDTAAVLDAVRQALARQDAEDTRRRAEAEAAVNRVAARAGKHGIDIPEPGRLEAEGLLDLVDRVDNAERAAARALALGAAKGAYGATDTGARAGTAALRRHHDGSGGQRRDRSRGRRDRAAGPAGAGRPDRARRPGRRTAAGAGP